MVLQLAASLQLCDEQCLWIAEFHAISFNHALKKPGAVSTAGCEAQRPCGQEHPRPSPNTARIPGTMDKPAACPQ
jgi:hypothetical protein